MSDAAPFLPSNPDLARSALSISEGVTEVSTLITDCNAVPAVNGYFACYDAANAPGPDGWFITMQMWPNGVHGIQFADTAFPSGTPQRWRRYRNGPTNWTGWSQII